MKTAEDAKDAEFLRQTRHVTAGRPSDTDFPLSPLRPWRPLRFSLAQKKKRARSLAPIQGDNTMKKANPEELIFRQTPQFASTAEKCRRSKRCPAYAA